MFFSRDNKYLNIIRHCVAAFFCGSWRIGLCIVACVMGQLSFGLLQHVIGRDGDATELSYYVEETFLEWLFSFPGGVFGLYAVPLFLVQAVCVWQILFLKRIIHVRLFFIAFAQVGVAFLTRGLMAEHWSRDDCQACLIACTWLVLIYSVLLGIRFRASSIRMEMKMMGGAMLGTILAAGAGYGVWFALGLMEEREAQKMGMPINLSFDAAGMSGDEVSKAETAHLSASEAVACAKNMLAEASVHLTAQAQLDAVKFDGTAKRTWTVRWLHTAGGYLIARDPFGSAPYTSVTFHEQDGALRIFQSPQEAVPCKVAVSQKDAVSRAETELMRYLALSRLVEKDTCSEAKRGIRRVSLQLIQGRNRAKWKARVPFLKLSGAPRKTSLCWVVEFTRGAIPNKNGSYACLHDIAVYVDAGTGKVVGGGIGPFSFRDNMQMSAESVKFPLARPLSYPSIAEIAAYVDEICPSLVSRSMPFQDGCPTSSPTNLITLANDGFGDVVFGDGPFQIWVCAETGQIMKLWNKRLDTHLKTAQRQTDNVLLTTEAVLRAEEYLKVLEMPIPDKMVLCSAIFCEAVPSCWNVVWTFHPNGRCLAPPSISVSFHEQYGFLGFQCFYDDALPIGNVLHVSQEDALAIAETEASWVWIDAERENPGKASLSVYDIWLTYVETNDHPSADGRHDKMGAANIPSAIRLCWHVSFSIDNNISEPDSMRHNRRRTGQGERAQSAVSSNIAEKRFRYVTVVIDAENGNAVRSTIR